MLDNHLDALVVGAGFGGIYMLRELRELGLNVKAIDMAGDCGGTWYWNRYPGAMSDTESYVYRYSWDTEDLQTYPWSRHYVQGPDVLAYLQQVVSRHDLRKDMQFNTELISADWDDDSAQWHLVLQHNHNTVQSLTSRYLITALGVLSRPNYPSIPGISSFKGTVCHTASWPTSLDLNNKRVGVIGNGSTGVQVITAIAPHVSKLVSFQRHPQYSVPSGDRPVAPAYREWVNANYPQIFHTVRSSITGFGFEESTTPYHSIPASDRTAVFQSLWDKGNGFRFMFGGFSDISTDREANEAACEFIRTKIDQTVADPEKARKLKPRDMYARRPLCDAGYYARFNLPHVDVVSLQETPIDEIVAGGIRTADGTVHELDVIIFATGFDAIEGSYNRLRFKGRQGVTLKEYWDKQGPTSYLGVAVPNFPNLLLVLGPQGPFSNMPPAIEEHVRLGRDLIARAEAARHAAAVNVGSLSLNGHDTVNVANAGVGRKSQQQQQQQVVIEALPDAERSWLAACDEAAAGSLFKETASWIFGCNVPGKTVALRFYFGGLKKYIQAVEKMRKNGYWGFKPLETRRHTVADGRKGDGEVVEEKVNGETKVKKVVNTTVVASQNKNEKKLGDIAQVENIAPTRNGVRV